MPQPNKAQVQAKLKAKFGRSTRTGGKHSVRRKRFKGASKGTDQESKKLGQQLKRLNLNSIPQIEEVNLFQDDGEIVHFVKPKVEADITANTYYISGNAQHKNLEQLLPGILQQLRPEDMANIASLKDSFSALTSAGTGDDEVPQLIDENFEAVAQSDEKTEVTEESTSEDTEEKFDISTCESEPLKKNWDMLTPEEKQAAEVLIHAKQSAMFNEWPDPGTEDDDKRRFLAQVLKLNSEYPGGLPAYHKRALVLLKESVDGVNPYEGWVPSVPKGEKLEFDTPAFNEFEKLGLTELGATAFILGAGGLGERLGYPGIKPELPSQITTETSFMESYIRSIIEFQKYGRRETKNDELKLQLGIMVSDDTIVKTKALMKDHDNFGLDEDQVTWLHQTKVVALKNIEADFYMKSKYEIETKPGGHGHVHKLLYSSGAAKRWEENGTKWLFFMQDTNGVLMRGLVSSIGVSVKNGFVMNSIAVPRRPGQALGAITKLTNETTNRAVTINVEYNQLEPLLLNTGDKTGDLPDDSGYSVYPGNCNSLILRLDTYNKVMKESKGIIPEFVNPKYENDKITFKKPTRLESMMQEYPKLLDDETVTNVGMTQVPFWLGLVVVKNNIRDAKIKFDKIGAADSASTGESGVYYANRRLLEAAGVEFEEAQPSERSFGGIPVRWGARVVIQPTFGVTLEQIKSKIKGKVRISAKSTLILDGENVTIGNLNLDGTLIVNVADNTNLTIENLSVTNEGWDFKEVDPDSVEPRYGMRGYVLDKKEQRIIELTDGGNHVIDEK